MLRLMETDMLAGSAEGSASTTGSARESTVAGDSSAGRAAASSGAGRLRDNSDASGDDAIVAVRGADADKGAAAAAASSAPCESSDAARLSARMLSRSISSNVLSSMVLIGEELRPANGEKKLPVLP